MRMLGSLVLDVMFWLETVGIAGFTAFWMV
ncbi:hypothetical protein BKA01_001004 [Pseudonocardia eucalypti]|nr:hypothetical protein [Pseudonocardia eucalypti]